MTDPSPPLKYVGGHPAVDLVDTVDWTARGLANERLTDYARLTRWAEGAGVITAARGSSLRRRAAARPRDAERELESARRIRSILQRIFADVIGGRPDREALADLNGLLDETLGRLELAPSRRSRDHGAAAEWTWAGADEALGSPLWPVIRAAAELLTSDEAARLRMCAGADCGWMFVDRSRNGLRRWCQMETCGTAAKSRRRRKGAAGRGSVE